MSALVFLLEEQSAGEMLEIIVPKLIPDGVDREYIVCEGKSDLDKKIERKLQGYRKPQAKFLILRDQDNGNCENIKTSLLNKIPDNKKNISLVRIACSELESFYLGDLRAVEKGMGITGIANQQRKHKYREPDKLSNAKEELGKLTNNRYQKISGSRAIAPYMNLEGENCSPSFNQLVSGIRTLL